MIVINNQEEMKPYYNKETNTYIFSENNRLIDIKIDFDLNIKCNIEARNIESWDIKSGDINAWDINACNIDSGDIKSCNIKSGDIKAWDINARNIKAGDIKAVNIKSNNIDFNAVCFAYESFVCNTIIGRRENSKYFCLDSEVVIKSKNS